MDRNNLERLANNPSLLHIVCLSKPYRYGVRLFLARLRTHFGEVNCSIRNVEWEDMEFFVISIPIGEKALAERIAKRIGVPITDGIPTVLDANGQRWFPMSSSRVFTLAGRQCYVDETGERKREEQEIRNVGSRFQEWFRPPDWGIHLA